MLTGCMEGKGYNASSNIPNEETPRLQNSIDSTTRSLKSSLIRPLNRSNHGPFCTCEMPEIRLTHPYSLDAIWVQLKATLPNLPGFTVNLWVWKCIYRIRGCFLTKLGGGIWWWIHRKPIMISGKGWTLSIVLQGANATNQKYGPEARLSRNSTANEECLI